MVIKEKTEKVGGGEIQPLMSSDIHFSRESTFVLKLTWETKKVQDI